MPYRACVFQHRSDYTHIHSEQITLSDTSALQLVIVKTRFLALDTIVSTWAFQLKSADNVTPTTLARVTRSISSIIYNNTRNRCNMIIVIISLVFVACIRMLLCLDQSVIISADSCSIGTLVLLQTSNIVLSSTYLNMGMVFASH